MFELFGLLGWLCVGAAWKVKDSADMSKTRKVAEEYRKAREGTNKDRQTYLYALYSMGIDENHNYIREPHNHPKEAMRLVKRQLEKEGIKYYNETMWNLDYCVYDDEGYIVSVCGHHVDRKTGRYID